jgi:Fe-S cluster assembly ATP-binding protein
MLEIKNLTVKLGDEQILENINLQVKQGEIHAVMGPQFSSKSNLALSILGNPNFTFQEGSIFYKKKNISDQTIDKRSQLGMYVSFQNPPPISGISNFELITNAVSFHNKRKSSEKLVKEYKELCKKFGLPESHGDKIVNADLMAPDEAKKNELMQMTLINPDFIVLDEIDESVSAEQLTIIAEHIKNFLSGGKKAAIIITHSRTLLDILQPTHVHVMVKGSIVEQGLSDLYKRIVEDGYSQFS